MKEKLGSPECRRKIYIKMDQNTDWIQQAQDRDQRRALVNTVMNLRIPQNAGNFLIC
jgi:hypothetical protein